MRGQHVPKQDATHGRLDADSFRGKLWLLVFDKIILGAMIGLALIVFKVWSTNEQREYDDRTTLSFQRAEYIKQLGPIVTNENEDVFLRAEALVALVRTNAIDSRSALLLARRVCLARQSATGRPASGYVNRGLHVQDVLLDGLLPRMPAALDQLLEQFVADHHDLRRGDDAVGPGLDERELHEDLERLWVDLFFETVEQKSDTELRALDDYAFLNLHFTALREIAQQPHAHWANRKVRGLRILGSFEVLEWGRKSPTPSSEQRAACQFLVSEIRSPLTFDSAATKIYVLQMAEQEDCSIGNFTDTSPCIRPEFAAQLAAASIPLVTGRDRANSLAGVRGRELSNQAAEYVAKAMSFPEVADQLEPEILPVVRQFAERLRSASRQESACDYPPPERELVRALVLSRSSEPWARPSAPVAEELQLLFSIPADRIRAACLSDLESEWTSRRVSPLSGPDPIGPRTSSPTR